MIGLHLVPPKECVEAGLQQSDRPLWVNSCQCSSKPLSGRLRRESDVTSLNLGGVKLAVCERLPVTKSASMHGHHLMSLSTSSANDSRNLCRIDPQASVRIGGVDQLRDLILVTLPMLGWQVTKGMQVMRVFEMA